MKENRTSLTGTSQEGTRPPLQTPSHPRLTSHRLSKSHRDSLLHQRQPPDRPSHRNQDIQRRINKEEERPGPIEGVIVGLHPEITTEEVIEELRGNPNHLDPCSFRRFYQKRTKTQTWKGCNHRKTCLCCAGHHALADCPTPRDSPKCANCRRSHIASYRGCLKFIRATEEAAKKTPPPPKTPRPFPPVTTSNPLKEDLQKKQDSAIEDMKKRHQEQIEAIRTQHRITIERIEESNMQLFHQLREDRTAQLNKMKGRITHFLGDVLTTLIPQKGDTAPSDLRKDLPSTSAESERNYSRSHQRLRRRCPSMVFHLLCKHALK
ncbi:hypothetical protein HOLleu_09310 [Holothuria leucospilota]|uniref:Uncharacterized protein n=1 Tax=Holothuria leucospilota TaxID=206669 RepID=A0A9Q1HE18_HOLLE|nr:hypothetical protein HOLleu_09310 [Holothuria leucospilota]